MAEFAAAAMASVAAGIGTATAAAGEAIGVTAAAAGTATAAAGTAAASGGILSSLGTVSTVAGILSGGASVLSMMAQKRQGDEAAQSLYNQAADTRIDIGNENVKEGAQRVSLRKALLDTIGERDAAYAASGIDLSFGSPAQARSQADDDANAALTANAAQTDGRVSRLNEKAANLILMGQSAKRRGETLAAITGIEGAGKVLKRG